MNPAFYLTGGGKGDDLRLNKPRPHWRSSALTDRRAPARLSLVVKPLLRDSIQAYILSS